MNTPRRSPSNKKDGNKLRTLKIRWKSTLPIIQWWMWVWISIAELAWAVAREWGIWTLSSVWLCLTPRYKNIYKEYLVRIKANKRLSWWLSKLSREELLDAKNEAFKAANLECLRLEIRKAKQISEWKWQIWLNMMVAANDYEAHVRVACEEWIDGIVSWAWLPIDLPKYTKDQTTLVPILSNAQGISIMLRKWWKNYKRLPDAFVLEDPSTAGGHLWASWGKIENINNEETKLETSIPASLKVIREFLAKIRKENPDLEIPDRIPVIAAWWAINRKDVDKLMALWASWVQMWTRFLASEESWASKEFKEAIVRATIKDIKEYISNALLPARALDDKSEVDNLFRTIGGLKAEVRKCAYNCLSHCAYRDWIGSLPSWIPAQMCILLALVYSTEWNFPEAYKRALRFVWTSAALIQKIKSVKTIVKEILNPKKKNKKKGKKSRARNRKKNEKIAN